MSTIPNPFESRRGISERRETNPDLQQERDGASFDSMQLTHFLDGGSDGTYRRRHIENLALSDPEYDFDRESSQLSLDEAFKTALKHHVQLVRKTKEFGFKDKDYDIYNYFAHYLNPSSQVKKRLWRSGGPMFELHANQFQQEKWLKDIKDHRIIGCYAQTELGHGSFLRGLETTAEYDKERGEFVLNSPTLTSTKWWAGTMGWCANHALVMAQLMTEGKNRGPHPFLVQIRDMDTHNPLPGIAVGNIGPKYGLDAIDNGFLRLENIRIPRMNMLMKHFEVHPDGSYTPAKNAKVINGGMLRIRCQIPSQSASILAKAVTIAIRYSCVRRQSEMQPGAPEPQVLDFQTQQEKLFPILAQAYAFTFTGKALTKLFEEGIQEGLNGDPSKLLELHAQSSVLKAYMTSRGVTGIETCRMACGGHGYSRFSGFPTLLTGASASVTVEGDVTVLLLQNARYLIKCFEGKVKDAQCAYLLKEGYSRPKLGGKLKIDTILDCMAFRAKLHVNQAFTQMSQLKLKGVKSSAAWNTSSVAWTEAAIAHAEYISMKAFADTLPEIPNGPVRVALHNLCLLFGLHVLVRSSSRVLIQADYLSADDLSQLELSMLELYEAIRPDAVALVDAFDFTNRHLMDSVLGRYDGKVYEHINKRAEEYNHGRPEVHPMYEKYLEGLIKSRM
ncbi:hypothetical protein CAPTEDRAFT_20276 [Capitella teleta]|uniref:Acyl-coenzyme A oxidase n=1 Tax=Capitella teleta TaxID=283909 RepID=R7UQD5_CAPTE|nr:hypothetical protein CAPTEDRAFT_20276 [Capitella teleta]|eukprot:ELU06137.1 hypothetical protein CAPTEDRAFT_20276 [Capitella teleta]